MTKVLLTHGYFLADDAKEQKIMKPYPPLGLLYLSAYLENNGIENLVFDTTFSSRDKLYETILASSPAVIGIYVNLMTKINVLEIIQFVKTRCPLARIVLGGPEIRYSAENFLSHGADVVVIGEGEQSMLEVTQRFLGNERLHPELKGIMFKEGGTYVQTPEREKLKDLDLLPEPARNKIDLDLYLTSWKHVHGLSAMSISTMRGCPYTCKWCSRAVYGLSYRRRTPEKVVEELAGLVRRYGPDSFWFVDDVFTISHKWLRTFHDELHRTGLKVRFECITRADRMNEEVIQLLKASGCFRVWIGAESGSQKVIDLMDRRVDVNQVREMIRMSRKNGIEAGTFIMLGYPGETEADIEETIHHLKESNPDHFTITVAYPIKGTELFQEVELTSSGLSWATSTDRDLDFKRTYSRKYYDYAVRRVVNEVNFNKNVIASRSFRAVKFKAKSLFAKLGMMLNR
jgi:anaerobic magnesium-protoporphyrin IX monomethyl ester cyclase